MYPTDQQTETWSIIKFTATLVYSKGKGKGKCIYIARFL